MNKIIGLTVLALGIGLTAGFGSVLSPEFRGSTIKRAEATFADADVETELQAYCELRQAFKLPDRDGCGDSGPLVGAGTEMGIVERREAELAALKFSKEVLIIEVSQARTQYRLALRKSLKRWRQLAQMGTQGPGQRLTGWLNEAGLGFGIGLVLLVAGAWICRKSHAVGAAVDGSKDDGLMDFGDLLESVSGSITAIAGDMEALTQPSVADLDGFKVRLEGVQKDALARLCASGPQTQARYGVEGMALLFSPLSSAERKLNRAWAAMVDRHWPEAVASVRGASLELDAARQALGSLV